MLSSNALSPSESDPRRALRRRLCGVRDEFLAGNPAAHAALAAHLGPVLAELQPERLGLYWALESEFNAATACFGDKALLSTPVALPYARRAPPAMEYRAWDRHEPTLRD
jgi:5-formyltetrahydrofolate cyclo-ligase